MKVWDCAELKEVTLGQKFLVAHCGSGRTYFGEYAILVKATEKHLVFKTESGVTVKTSQENLNKVVGKAGIQGYFVSSRINGRDDDKNFIHQSVFVY